MAHVECRMQLAAQLAAKLASSSEVILEVSQNILRQSCQVNRCCTIDF